MRQLSAGNSLARCFRDADANIHIAIQKNAANAGKHVAPLINRRLTPAH